MSIDLTFPFGSWRDLTIMPESNKTLPPQCSQLFFEALTELLILTSIAEEDFSRLFYHGLRLLHREKALFLLLVIQFLACFLGFPAGLVGDDGGSDRTRPQTLRCALCASACRSGHLSFSHPQKSNSSQQSANCWSR